MGKHQMKYINFPLVALVLACGLPTYTSAQTANCKALVQARNNLFFVKEDGTLIAQLTNDRQLRTAAALNSNGSIVAFSGDAAPNDVTLIDASGHVITNIDLHAIDAITGLKWITSTMLRAGEHLGQYASRFHFVSVSNGVSSILGSSKAEGSNCALSPSGKDLVCAIDDTVLTLNGNELFRVPDAFTTATVIQAVDATVGTSVTASTNPTLKIDVKEITKDNKTQLRITTQDGLWTEQYISPGDYMDVSVNEPASLGPSTYAVVPTVNNNVVHLIIKKSNSGYYRFEGDLAWDPRGKRIALVEGNSLGQRTLVLLNKEMGKASEKGNGGIDLEEILPLTGPVRSVVFTSETHIRVEGLNQVIEKDIPAQGKVPAGLPYTTRPALPQKLTVNVGGSSLIAEVKGWSCS